MKRGLLIVFFIGCILSLAGRALAVPTQFGETGLLSQPSADTLSSGNICLGLWGNFANRGSDGTSLIPVSLTLGLGSFMEAYGTYPNLLFNGDEGGHIDANGKLHLSLSGRGYAAVGMKIRVLGKRSSRFKLAVDGQLRRSIADDPRLDGLASYMGRLIASYRPGRFGIHLNAGYIANDSPTADIAHFENQYTAGGGIEYYPWARLRLIAELAAATEKIKGTDGPREATLGFQYFLSPHFTVNIGAGVGLSPQSPDWRAIVGFSSCQGVGSYLQPVPKIIQPPVQQPPKEKPEKVKPLKIKMLTPLIPKVRKIKTSPVSKLEVPVAKSTREVVLQPAERLVLPKTGAAGSLPASPISPMVPPPPQARKVVAEIASGKPIKGKVYRQFRLKEWSFGFDQWNLSAAGKKAVGQVLEELRKDKKWFVILIEGYTDSIASQRYNDKLSLKRAVAIGTFMVVHTGFDPARIFVKGMGERDPIASNTTPKGRKENRRVELLVVVPTEAAK